MAYSLVFLNNHESPPPNANEPLSFPPSFSPISPSAMPSSCWRCPSFGSFCPLPVALRHSLRWLILAISLLAFTLIYANNITFNFSVICIIRPSIEPIEKHANQTNDHKEAFYHDYSVQQRNLLFSAAAVGAICCSLAITQLIGKLGTRIVFTLFGLLSAIACFLMPLAVNTGFVPMFILRMVLGSVHPLQNIMISQLTREWAPLRTSGTYLLILSAQFQLAHVFTMPISGLLCESPWGWPAIYYLQAILTILAFALFYFVFRDTPKQHPWISDKEMRCIMRDKDIMGAREEKRGRKKGLKVPYKQMLTDPILWIVLFTFWSDELGFLIFSQYGPIYLNRVLGMDIEKTGLLAGLPYLLSMATKFLSGPINDRLPWKSERIRINIFSAISQIGIIIAFATLTVLPMVQGIPQWLVQVAYTSVNIFGGLDFLGVIKCSQHISQHFASTIMAWESIISSVTVLLLPMLVGLAAPNNTVDEWARILVGIALFETITIVLFFLFCDSKPRPWAVKPMDSSVKGDSGSGGMEKKDAKNVAEKF